MSQNLERLKREMKELKYSGKPEEEMHIRGDEILCEVLVMLGQHQLVYDFLSLERWYA